MDGVFPQGCGTYHVSLQENILELRHTFVKRGGITAKRWYGGTQVLDARLMPDALRLRFQLPSKGGGQTDIMLEIGAKDWPSIIQAFAVAQPGLAESLAEATLKAIQGQ
jgi:hypothetical protein